MKIFTTTLYALMIVFLLAIAGVFVASLIPVPGHISIKIVKSGSMEPTIHVGAIVIVQPQENYRVGDVITFGPDTKIQIPTTHRIIALSEENGSTRFTTKGDANEDPDGNKTSLAEIHGKVILSVPAAGYVLDFAKKPLGFALMIAVPATIIILDELVRIWSEVQNMRRNKNSTERAHMQESVGEVTLEELSQIEPLDSSRSRPIDGVSRRTRIQ